MTTDQYTNNTFKLFIHSAIYLVEHFLLKFMKNILWGWFVRKLKRYVTRPNNHMIFVSGLYKL